MATDSQGLKDGQTGGSDVQARYDRAISLTKKYSLGTAGAGLVPLPAVDMIAITAIQLKLLKELSGIYNVEFSSTRGKAIIGALLSGLGVPLLAGPAVVSVLKIIPGLGNLFVAGSLSIMAAASTYALGRVFIQHYESGGTLLSFDPKTMHDHYRRYFEEARREQGAAKGEATIITPASAP